MAWIILIISVLIFINFILLKYSCNECEVSKKTNKPKFNKPAKNNIIGQPLMAEK
jgi:hypothetical protein